MSSVGAGYPDPRKADPDEAPIPVATPDIGGDRTTGSVPVVAGAGDDRVTGPIPAVTPDAVTTG